MCLSPIRIRNPNAGMTGLSSTLMKDTTSAFINVPCGHCSQCIANRQMDFVQRILCESMVNHLFFCTLTYNNDMLPSYHTSTGFNIRFADFEHLQKMFKRLRVKNAFCRPFRYFAVSERGTKKGRPHFHILFMLPKHEDDTFVDCLNLEKVLFDKVLSEWKVNVGSDRKPVYKPLLTYVSKFIRGKIRKNYDLHYVNPVLSSGQEADVAFYVLKYMLKPNDKENRLRQALYYNLPEDEYKEVWQIVKSKHSESEAFGFGQSIKKDGKYVFHPKILSYLVDCVQRSKSSFPYPCFFNPITGKTFPLSHYYKGFADIYSYQDALDFYYNDKEGRVDNVVLEDVKAQNEIYQCIEDFDKKVRVVADYDSALELDELFD